MAKVAAILLCPCLKRADRRFARKNLLESAGFAGYATVLISMLIHHKLWLPC